MPLAAIIFAALFGGLWFWLLGGFVAGKINLFSCFGILFLLVSMRVTSLGLDIASAFTDMNVGMAILFNLLFVESYCFLTVCLYDFLSVYRQRTTGENARRIFTGIASFFLALIAIGLGVAAIMNACVASNVVKDPVTLAAVAGWINAISMICLFFFTVFWIGPLIRTAGQDGNRCQRKLHGTLVCLLLAWICLMIRVVYAVFAVFYGVAGKNASVASGLTAGWLWLSLAMDFLATALIAGTYFPSRALLRSMAMPTAYNPYPGGAVFPVYPGSAMSVNSLAKEPVVGRNSFQ